MSIKSVKSLIIATERRGNTKILVINIEPDSNLIKSNPYKQESTEPASK